MRYQVQRQAPQLHCILKAAPNLFFFPISVRSWIFAHTRLMRFIFTRSRCHGIPQMVQPCQVKSMPGNDVSALVQWNLSWETTAMRDHLSWKTIDFWQKVLHFSVNEPVTKAHLSWDHILWPMGWSFKTGSTVLYSSHRYTWPIQYIKGNIFSTCRFPF